MLAYDGRLLRRLWPFVKPHASFVVLSLATLVVIAAINWVRPLLLGDVVRQAGAHDASRLVRDGLAIGGLLVLVQSLTYVQMYTMQVAGARAMADLRTVVFRFFQSLRLRYYDRTPVGRLVTRATNDVDAVNELFASGALNAMGDLVSLGWVVVALMLALDWRLLDRLVPRAARSSASSSTTCRTRSRAAYRDVRARTARLNAFLNEQVNGIAVVQAFVRERSMADEFDAINVDYRDANKRAIYYEAVLDAAIEMVSTLCIASILWFSGMRRVGAHAITFPLLVTFTQYIRQFFEPVSLLLAALHSLAERDGRRRAHLRAPRREGRGATCPPARPVRARRPPRRGNLPRARRLLVQARSPCPPRRVVQRAARRARGAGRGDRGREVDRRELAPPALRGGESGSCAILGCDVRSYEPHDLRRQFSVVPQDVFLFAGTVLSNVAISDPAPDRGKAEEALRRVGAFELFARREDGLDARVDERGQNFSAGERQLLAFARAIYRGSPLLVLDEATASVDSDTEARLQRALEEVVRGRTSLVIAHRLSTIRAADRIVCFHKGRVVEMGTHEELLQRGEVYARLYRMQFAHEQAHHRPSGASIRKWRP